MTRIRPLAAASLVATLVAARVAAGEDSGSQFRGPNRDGVSVETGLVRSWSEAGPKELWRVPIGDGFAPKLGITPAPPVFVEPDLIFIFVSASYGVGAEAVRLRAEGGRVVTEDVWEGTQMRNHFNASVARDAAGRCWMQPTLAGDRHLRLERQ